MIIVMQNTFNDSFQVNNYVLIKLSFHFWFSRPTQFPQNNVSATKSLISFNDFVLCQKRR